MVPSSCVGREVSMGMQVLGWMGDEGRGGGKWEGGRGRGRRIMMDVDGKRLCEWVGRIR